MAMGGVGARLLVVLGADAETVLREVVKPACDVRAIGGPLHRRVYERVTCVGIVQHRLTAAQKRWIASACAVNATVEYLG